MHAADLHLDTPFKGLSATAPHVGAALREASLDAFDRLVQLCLDRDAAFLVVAGDVYDGAERGLRAQLRFRDGLARLSEASIPSFVAHGNHDPVKDGWAAISDWPPLVHVFSHEHVETFAVERAGEKIASVHGISYGHSEVTENLALRFSREDSPVFQVGVLHCNVAGAADGYAAYSPCTLSDLCNVGLDYFALGHIHSRLVLSGQPLGREPFVVYPGNLQARSPKPSELGPKGASVVHVTGGVVEAVEAVACDQVRFSLLELEIDGVEDLTGLCDALVSRAVDQLSQAEGRSIVVRAWLSGRGSVHRDLARPGALDELVATLRGEFPAHDPFCWWDRVVDDSAPEIDLAELATGGDLSADLLTTAEEMKALVASGPRPALPLDAMQEFASQLPRSLQRRAAELVDEGAVDARELVDKAVLSALDRLGVGT